MARRGKGEGAIYQRKNGTWCGQYRTETLQGVKRKYIYGKTRREVASKLAKAIAEMDSGLLHDSGSLTFSDYLDRWFNSTKSSTRSSLGFTSSPY